MSLVLHVSGGLFLVLTHCWEHFIQEEDVGIMKLLPNERRHNMGGGGNTQYEINIQHSNKSRLYLKKQSPLFHQGLKGST